MRINRWMIPASGRVALAALATLLLLTACGGRTTLKPSSWHLPWHKTPPAAPVAVQELPVQSEAGVSLDVPQYWSRNTLRVDLSGFGGIGSLKLLPSPVNGWPARLELAVGVGSITQLEVQGDQRAVFVVSALTSDGTPQVLPVSA